MDQILSVNTLIYHGYDLPTALSEIAQLNFRYVELAFITGYSSDLNDEDFSEKNALKIRGMLADFGLSTVAFSGHMDLGSPHSVVAFKRRLEFAKAVGAKITNTNACKLSDRNLFFKNIEELATFAESLDIIIALENPGDGEDNIISSGKMGVAIIEEIGSDHVRLNYDFCNTFIYSKGEMGPEEDYHFALPFAAHLHLKDVKKEKTGWSYCEIGKGVIDYKKILHSLLKKSKSIPMGIEIPMRLKRTSDFIPYIDLSPAKLSEIEGVLRGSLKFIKSL